MPVVMTRMYSVKMEQECPKCGGEMFWTGVEHSVNPPTYPHECNECGELRSYKAVYPKIDHLSAQEIIRLRQSGKLRGEI
jgi:uncharacterized Zn finger protein